MNNIIEVIENIPFRNILKKNLPDFSDDIFEAFKNTINSPKYIIPVLGIQGSGKSSFLNALLLKDIILPVDADETTCIPTEISYIDNEQPVAEVYYKDGRTEKISCSEMGLKPYIHNQENPGNKKEVDYISIRFAHPLLKTGVIFVDLPGVGSITESNANTTMSYIKKATGAIFMLRTVPPITRSESVFIQGILPLMSQTFFVQNQWFDERLDEAEDGKEHNLEVLKKVSKNVNNNPYIDIVNVMSALNAGIRDDSSLLNKSGLPSITNKLNDFIKDWKSNSYLGINNILTNYINLCIQKINFSLELNSKSHEEQLMIYKNEEKIFENELNDKKLKVAECLKLLEEEKDNLNEKINEICKRESEDFRNDVRERIRAGTTDARLNNAFNDLSREKVNTIYETLQPEILEIFYKVNSVLEGIEEFSFNNISLEEKNSFKKQSQIHNMYSKLGAGAGIIGTLYLGGGLAAIGTAILPGVGTLVGLGIGIGVTSLAGFFGKFLGNKAKQVHLNKQQNYAQTHLFKLIEEFKKEIISNYQDNLSEYCDTLESKIDNWFSDQKENFESRMKDLKRNSLKSDEEKDNLNRVLKSDIEFLNKIYKQLEN